MAAVLAKGKTHDFAMFGQAGGINNEVHLGMLFVALPETSGVVDKIDARATFGDFVGANHFVEMHPHFGRRVGHGQTGNAGIFFQAAPVTLVGEGLATGDAQRGEDAPAADETSLAGRKAHLLDRQQRVVMKDVRVNHQVLAKRG